MKIEAQTVARWELFGDALSGRVKIEPEHPFKGSATAMIPAILHMYHQIPISDVEKKAFCLLLSGA